MNLNLEKRELIPNDTKLERKINPRETYAIFQEGIPKPVFMMNGRDFIDRYSSNNWLSVFNSGHQDFITGLAYKVIKLSENENKSYEVWAQTAQNLSNPNVGLSNNVQIAKSPNEYPNMSNQFKSLADVLAVQNQNSTIALQQELQNKEVFIQSLQEQISKLYETVDKKMTEFSARELDYIKQLEAAKAENERIKIEMENTKWKYSIELGFMKERHKIDSDFEKRKRQLESTNDVGLKDLLGLAPMLMGMRGGGMPAPPTLSNQVKPQENKPENNSETNEMVEV